MRLEVSWGCIIYYKNNNNNNKYDLSFTASKINEIVNLCSAKMQTFTNVVYSEGRMEQGRPRQPGGPSYAPVIPSPSF